MVSKTSNTWLFDVFPTRVIAAVPASRTARSASSFSTSLPGFRVEPNATSTALDNDISFARLKKSASLGLDPGYPPSM